MKNYNYIFNKIFFVKFWYFQLLNLKSYEFYKNQNIQNIEY